MPFDGVVRTSPGDESRKEAHIPPLRVSNHGSNILCLPNNDLLCVWFSGSSEGNPDTSIVLSRLPSGEESWERPNLVSDDSEKSEQNPLLFLAPGDSLRILHTSNAPHNQDTARVRMWESNDLGRTWNQSTILPFEEGTFIRNRIVVLDSGDWLLPAYRCTPEGHFSFACISTDQGLSWKLHEVPQSIGRVHMCVVPLKDGQLAAFFRSRFADYIYRSSSHDHGRTWSIPEKTCLFNNNSSIQALRLMNGHLAMVFNDCQRGDLEFSGNEDPTGLPMWLKAPRNPVTIAISTDEGLSWDVRRNLEVLGRVPAGNQEIDLPGPCFETSETGEALMHFPVESHEVSYPSICQSSDGALHITYTYLRRCIKYTTILENWVTR